MSESEAVTLERGGVAAVTAEPERREAVEEDGPSRNLPPYRVVLLNDDDHTFAYVIRMLRQVFRMRLERAEALTRRVHVEGQAAVWMGSKEVAELKQEQVVGFGPDFYASQTVRYPLGCMIEPVD